MANFGPSTPTTSSGHEDRPKHDAAVPNAKDAGLAGRQARPDPRPTLNVHAM